MRVWFNGRTSAFQAEDAGSIPATRSIIRTTLNGFWLEKATAHIAQSVEHFLGKEEVIGSNPIVSTRVRGCSGVSRCTTKKGAGQPAFTIESGFHLRVKHGQGKI